MSLTARPTVLVISQVYVPDPASVGQHMADAAEAIAARGYRVVVLTSARGYENPRETFPRRERRGGVEIVRLPLSSFGKRSIAWRLLGQGLFLLQVILRGLFMRRRGGILVSTSPPMATFAAVVISFVRRTPITYWLMDLNPDQAIALGHAREGSLLVRAMRWLNRQIYSRASEVIVLDRFMAERVRGQYDVRGRMEVLPPWPHEESLASVPRDANPFIAEQKLAGQFVVMYSGNHSPASPVTTLVDAALDLQSESRLKFLFVGGGLGKRVVDEAIASHRPANIVSLPYQPLERVKYSLSAADVHTVTLGDDMVGLIHPCKIYGAMAVGRPILLVGPQPSHAADLIERYDIGWRIDHGDVAGAKKLLCEIVNMPPEKLRAMGERAREAVSQRFGKSLLCGQFCDAFERSLQSAQHKSVESHLREEQKQRGVARGTVVSQATEPLEASVGNSD